MSAFNTTHPSPTQPRSLLHAKNKIKYTHPANRMQDTLVAACLFGQGPSLGLAVGWGGQLARSPPLALLPAELSHRQTKPKHETNNAYVGLFIDITFNANASRGRGRTETSSSERGGFAQRPGACRAMVGQWGHAVQRLVPAP